MGSIGKGDGGPLDGSAGEDVSIGDTAEERVLHLLLLCVAG